MYLPNISSDRPMSIFLLVSEIIPRNFETQVAVSVLLGQSIVASLFSSDKFSKPGIRDDILPMKQFLFNVIVVHDKIACLSSSNLLLLQ